MAINDIVQTIAEARVDARSLSEFVFKPAGFKVARRLAPPVDTLQFYINRFNSLNGDFGSSVSVALSSLNSSVAEAEGKVAYIETTVQDAINNTAVEGGVLAATFVTVEEQIEGDGAINLRAFNTKLPLVVNTIAELLRVKTFGAGRAVIVKSYFGEIGLGSGVFVYNSSVSRSKHNGGSVISPTVPTFATQTGSTETDRLANFLKGEGETSPLTNGCWVNIKGVSGSYDISEFGALPDGSDSKQSIINSVESGAKEVTIKRNYYSSDIVATQKNDLVIKITGSLHITGNVSTSYFPFGFDLAAGGFDFTMTGGGVFDWAENNSPTIRRRTLNVTNSSTAKVKNMRTSSARFILEAERVEFASNKVESSDTVEHYTSSTGFFKAYGCSNGGLIYGNRVKANIAENGAEFIKVSGETSSQYANRGKAVVISANYLECTSDIFPAEIDTFNAGGDCIITGNTLINTGVHSKSVGTTLEGLGNSENINVSVTGNKFVFTRDTIIYPIYRRGGMIDISGNTFHARTNLTKILNCIFFDREPDGEVGVEVQQSDITITNNKVNFRLVTKDVDTFSFVTSNENTGTNREALSSIFSGNIVIGMCGLLRGALFTGGMLSTCILDFNGKTNYTAGNFRAKRIDGLTIKGFSGNIVTDADSVTNSPNVLPRNEYPDASVLNATVLDMKGRDVIALSDPNTASGKDIRSIINAGSDDIKVINLTTTPITYTLFNGSVTGSIAVGDIANIITYRNSSNGIRGKVL